MAKDQGADDDAPQKDVKSEDQIGALRNEIDEIDRQLIVLLSERREKSRAAAELKYSEHTPLRDQLREERLLSSRVQQAKEHGLDAHLVTKIFHEIIDDSVRYQQQFLQHKVNAADGSEIALRKVAFQGSNGSFSHLAAEHFFSRHETPVMYNGSTSYKLVLELVERGEVDYGILPIENTTSGGINEVYDLLQRTRLSLVGEEKLQITPCLLALPGATLAKISRVYSHPELILQCSESLKDFDAIENSFNTAATVEEIRKNGATNCAVVASEEAAHTLNLQVLQRGIANQQENYTRYLVIARQPVKVDERVPCKTSVVIATAHKPGALVEVLKVFQSNKVNLTKLESRPVVGNPWEEMFYLDFEGHAESDQLQFVLEEARRHSRFLRVLGSYPSPDIARTEVSLAQKGAGSQKGASNAIPRAKGTAAEASEQKKESSGSTKLFSRGYKSQDTIIQVKGVELGGDSFVIIGGPCSVESSAQIDACARHLKETGGHILRGGCFKPRTSPYSFQGLGYEGLELLVEAGKRYGVPVVTEVLAVEDVHRVAETADILQVGARNMQNFTLLQEIGRTQRPVMLKRGMSSSIEDMLNASEYILSQGNQQVFFCERGIRTFETATRNTLDLSAIPVIRQRSHLPVIVDPSHAAGTRELVIPLVFAAKAVGAHGVMVEFHPKPEEALSDGPQALLFDQWAEMMASL
ncbi:bifunctional 3-deoxy-7-phosphoheptulonate synthase/chorismate mutase [bacterium]|nr:bifunctional 3-deoxy-7-phosphoheptulonate synthase/chorismate mutase [bacterium]